MVKGSEILASHDHAAEGTYMQVLTCRRLMHSEFFELISTCPRIE